MATLQQLLSTLSENDQKRGSQFERICKWYLQNEPQYKLQLNKVWLWSDWPDRWGPDTGVDLVAEDVTGKLWAIQAKAYSPHVRITKKDVDTFLSESSRKDFSFRLIIGTTDLLSSNAERTLKGQEKPAEARLLTDLEKSELSWPESPDKLLPSLPEKRDPRDHQKFAIRDVFKGLKKNDRGQLIMACGTGKTLTALWATEKLKSQQTLILVPSLSLVSQTLAEWSYHSTKPFNYLVVCSDETVTQRGEDAAISSTSELGIPVTTDVKEIRQFLSDDKYRRPRVTFCTYQSSDRVALAQKGTLINFDLVIADEAHRCAGHREGLFSTILDGKKIKAKKRLFMTATPRYFTGRVKKLAGEMDYELASMDDENAFGPVLHRLSFNEAISEKLLTDYQVVVIGVTQEEIHRWAEEGRFVRTKDGLQTDARTLGSQIGLAKAIKKYHLSKIITFHSSVRKASNFTNDTIEDSLPGVIGRMTDEEKPLGQFWYSHISGKMPTKYRTNKLKAFGSLDDSTVGILSNCSCLGEGVDVPTLDGIAFIDPKRSMIDIIQAVGRVIRKADDKHVGTIVLPVFVDETKDDDTALSSSAFEPVWQVLKALRAHDDELANELDELRLKHGKVIASGSRVNLPGKIQLDVPALIMKDFAQSFYVRTVERTTKIPPLTIEHILEWIDAHHQRTGKWPTRNSGNIADAPGETWANINAVLNLELRGIKEKSSLAQILETFRGVRNIQNLPPLTIEQILEWIDAHHKRTGKWPTTKSGKIADAPGGETWGAINLTLARGRRGLKGKSSIAQILENHRGVRNKGNLPPLTVKQILEWCDAHHERTGKWPSQNSGSIPEASGERWNAIDKVLNSGRRGLKEKSSIAQILQTYRGVRNQANRPPLTIEQILEWADEHHQRTGKWPTRNSGNIADASGETWSAIYVALWRGHRGFKEESSLAQILETYRGVRNIKNRPPLTVKQILEWCDAHHKRTGKWPTRNSGPIAESDGETWSKIDSALWEGNRGIREKTSLYQIRKKHNRI